MSETCPRSKCRAASDHAARLKVGDERGRRRADFRYRERASLGERCREPRVWDDEPEAKRRYDLERSRPCCPIACKTRCTTTRLGSHGVYGVGFGIPSAYYLAALAAILKSGVGTRAQVGALLLFSLVAFAAAEIPLVSFAVAPEATRARVDQLYAWVSTHQRLVVTILASIAGVYLILIGISKL